MPGRWDDALSERFLGHYTSLRGLVRQTLVARQLDVHLRESGGRAMDLGAGDGRQGIRLARLGFEVVLVDPSPSMLEAAAANVAAETAEVQRRVELLHADIDGAVSLLEAQSFDVVLCHAVVPYLETSAPTIHELARLARVCGIVSLVAKNAGALAMRPALQSRWSDALAAFDAEAEIGGLGVWTRGDRLDDLTAMFDEAGLELLAWYGLRTFTDHLGGAPPGEDVETVLKVEWLASQRDPYRRLARLLHLVGRRRDSSGAAGRIRGS